MTASAQQAAAAAIFEAYEERHALSEAERSMKPAELAAQRAIAAMEAAAQAEEASDGWEWMLVEVLGHRRHYGRVREEERFGAKLLRIDVPLKGDPVSNGWQTHIYAAAALYGLTPCTRDTALQANKPYEAPARFAIGGPDAADLDDDRPF